MITKSRLARKKRIRAIVTGTTKRPRLSVYRSNKYLYGQIIDDTKGNTLASAYGSVIEVGNKLSEQAKKLKIKEMVFDRGGYKYHGKVKALAEAMREGGVKI